MRMSRLPIIALVALAVSTLSGCLGGGTDLADNIAREVGTCFGRVIDRSTRAGIEGATVEIFAGAIPSTDKNVSKSGKDNNLVVTTTTGADDADTTLFSESGMWVIGNLPTGDAAGYRVRIGATNYATVQTTCTFGVTSSDNTPLAEDLGDLQMVKGVTVSVNLVNVNTGAAIASCPVYAVPSTVAAGGNTGFGSDEPTTGTGGSQGTNVLSGVEVVATTDTAGLASLAGLNPLIDYTIVAPACDTDADGDYDLRTATAVLDTLLDSPSTFTVAMAGVGSDDTPALVASSCAQFGASDDPLLPGCGVAANGVLTFVFNYPVADLVTDQLQLALNGDAAFTTDSQGVALLGAAAVDFDGDETVDTAVDTNFAQALSAGNTVLTITPSAALSANALYSLDGVISANIPQSGVAGDIVSSDFGALLTTLQGNSFIYVFPASDTTIADPTVDNYNADDDSAVAAAICLEFDEIVVGSVQVFAQTGGSVTTTDANPVVVNLNTGSLINEGDNADAVCGGLGGCSSSTDGTCTANVATFEAIKYVVPLGALTAADTTTATPATATVYVNAQDYAGNRLQKVLTLPVH